MCTEARTVFDSCSDECLLLLLVFGQKYDSLEFSQPCRLPRRVAGILLLLFRMFPLSNVKCVGFLNDIFVAAC
jgi:hypothetical protein